MTSLPGAQWLSSAAALPMEPVGMNSAASLPVSSAARVSSALIVGSSP